jgi:hypothetical protein
MLPDQKDHRLVEVLLCHLRGRYLLELPRESRKLRIDHWQGRRRPQVLTSQIILQLLPPVAEFDQTGPQLMRPEQVDRMDSTTR